MRTVDYSDILQGSMALAGLSFADLDYTQPEFGMFRTFHDRRLRIAWEIHRWPEICRYERRSFRLPYVGDYRYVAGDEVLDVATLTYFQALRPAFNIPPTTAGVVNAAYWAQCQTALSVGEDYSATTDYEVGAQVRTPENGNLYQLFAKKMTVVGSSFDGVVFWPGADQAIPGRTQYVSNETGYIGVGDYGISSDGVTWSFYHWPGPGPALIDLYTSSDDVATPDLVTNWTPAGAYGAFTLAFSVGNPALGEGWGLLIPFQRYVAYEQVDVYGTALTPIAEVLAAYDKDPRVTTRNTKRAFTVTSDGFAFTTASAYVWLHYRLRRPTLTGAPFDATLVYTSGRQVYYTNTTTGVGNFYTCTATTSAGESPATTPAKWSVVEIPYLFREYLAAGGYADWLTSDGQGDKAAAMEAQCVGLLELEADKLQRQQQQVNRLDWL